MKTLDQKVGIVTGGSSGIGYQIANVLAENGATVYNISRTGAPKDGYEQNSDGVIHIKGDIEDISSIRETVRKIAAENNNVIDFLINNAGSTYKCRAEEFPEDKFDYVMNINVKYVFNMCQICYPYLKQSADRGRIINITSMSAHLGFSEVVPYCASKGAVLSMTRGLAVEWSQDNICVNSIAPGWFKSKMLDSVMDPEREKKILGRMPLHQLGDTRDIGALASFLCSADAGYITGQDFAVDGGALAYGY